MPAENALLLPGMMCDARLWAPQIEKIGIPAAVPALDGADSMETLASQVLEAAPPAFALAGLSMGGILAFEIWRQAPDRVTHLALLDTNPHSESPERAMQRLEQIEQVLNGGLRDLVRGSLKPLYLAACNRNDDELLATIMAMTLDLGPEVFQRQTIAVKNRPDSVPTLPTISCPTVVMCGREDTLCPVSYHELMADRIPKAELVVLDDCGHLASLEQPDRVTAELVELFDQ